MRLPGCDALRDALDNRYQMRATYRGVLAALGLVRPFVGMVPATDIQIGALQHVFTCRGWPFPADRWRVAPPPSLRDAFRFGIRVEAANAALYGRLMAATDDPDIHRIFAFLQTASDRNLVTLRRHLGRPARQGQT